jgi:hypothetical protein
MTLVMLPPPNIWYEAPRITPPALFDPVPVEFRLADESQIRAGTVEIHHAKGQLFAVFYETTGEAPAVRWNGLTDVGTVWWRPAP